MKINVLLFLKRISFMENVNIVVSVGSGLLYKFAAVFFILSSSNATPVCLGERETHY